MGGTVGTLKEVVGRTLYRVNLPYVSGTLSFFSCDKYRSGLSAAGGIDRDIGRRTAVDSGPIKQSLDPSVMSAEGWI
jgi:hypothetical protein